MKKRKTRTYTPKYRAIYTKFSSLGFYDLGASVHNKPLTKVPKEPGVGQYSCPSPNLYVFNTRDRGKKVSISYQNGNFQNGGMLIFSETHIV